ncbi:RNA polymerase, sigma 54 subunit, RpoN [Paenibacillus mucilaginosus 3016]|uniref:RNA polymerase, sigma 54 subunit, RpoN n=2 Tax=Paenibacillus mucilaginosus TaxID=61624 RepID=H6NRG0_9BACL|nr:RNA polymerase factor sigma-54 [Paenibacillus mucilaginosus]AFC33595.1 RNA polymerase, sigma 54 subunit, RpoN [Paenibacillus mucilaginosus 3016]
MITGLSQTTAIQMKTTLTPELQQSVHILQLTGTDLLSYLQEQALENPLLELEWSSPSARRSAGSRHAIGPGGGEDDRLGRLPARGETLEQALLSQLRIAGLPADLYRAAAFLVGSLDGAGYLLHPLGELAGCLGADLRQLEDALREVQRLEPAGIGARDLRECLLLQAGRDPQAPPGTADALSEACFPLVARGRWEALARRLGLPPEAVREIARYIRGLQPRPGSLHPGERTHYVVPDAEVRLERGELLIRWNAELTPRLTVQDGYERLGRTDGEAAAYLKSKRRGADWLMRAVEQRYRTLKRVIAAIFEEQPGFWGQGLRGLRPMNLRTIADKLGLHESTVSRAVNGKYVRTCHGTFELKAFFAAVPLAESGGGGGASSLEVKSVIAELVAGENKGRPYSDEKLAQELSKRGLQVARRTVAKYREELHILSSSLRKRVL